MEAEWYVDVDWLTYEELELIMEGEVDDECELEEASPKDWVEDSIGEARVEALAVEA